MVEASLDRLGVCNRLNLLLVDAVAAAELLPALATRLQSLGIEARGTERAREHAELAPLDVRLGHEWANDAHHVATVSVEVVDGPDEAARLANEETSALAATVVADDEEVARRFLERYRGTAAFWQAPTRFTDGFALTGAPETGINVDWVPGPRGPVTYRDLWLRQYRVVGDGTQRR
jgi:glutamate-5-semialdehyde dehydrogenase